MSVSVDTSSSPDVETDWNGNGHPKERWAPLGADDEQSVGDSAKTDASHSQRSGESLPSPGNPEVDNLREENEQMANSLLSLTSHFAQIQFRLKQISSGDPVQLPEKLKELEQFAQTGVPDLKSCVIPTKDKNGQHLSSSEDEQDEYQRVLSEKQKAMILELREQLSNLESYAYESGFADDIPTSRKLEQQEILIEEIKNKLQISNLDNISSLSTEQLKHCVDEAVAQIVNPALVKEKQLEQLRTQVIDLERFVDFLQDEVNKTSAANTSQVSSPLPPQKNSRLGAIDPTFFNAGSTQSSGIETQSTGASIQGDHESMSARLKRVVMVFHMYVLSELGCASKQREGNTNSMKQTSQEPHFGDLLAVMQMNIDKLFQLTEKIKQEQEDSSVFTDCDYFSDDENYVSESKELTTCVRKEFAIALKDLLEHGMYEKSASTALIRYGVCGASKRSASNVPILNKPNHIWQVVLAYYHLKNGKEFNESTTVRLANSFGIEAVAGQVSNVKQSLLSGIGHILETHTPYQRSDDSMFKAFVCLGLNQKKLVPWLRQIVRTTAVIDDMYQPWSYVVRTGCEDILCAMNKLKLFDFKLSVDQAVKQFFNMSDAF